ncbi:Endosulfine-domain-containing protein, partial [Choiromyces venosus 120613-1]
PHQKQKVDISSMNEEEQKLFRLYGKLPSKKDILKNKLKERKYFDSGDYALSKAGKASDVGVTNIGSQHPLPENIPHHTAAGTPTGSSGNSGSPVKESPLLHAKSPMGSQPPTEGEDAGDAEE